MRIRVVSILLVFCLGFVTESIWGQGKPQSLGDVARKERERRQAQSDAAAHQQQDTLSTARTEGRALLGKAIEGLGGELPIHRQSVSILHQDMTGITEFGFFNPRFRDAGMNRWE